MQLQGRSIEVFLIQNLGSGLPGSVLNVSDNLEDISNISFDLDSTLTKISQGSCSIKIIDDSTATIWTWLQNNIQSSQGILPPFMTIAVDGEPVYYGVINAKGIDRTISNNNAEINISSQEWSNMFGKLKIDGDGYKRQFPQIQSARPTSSPKTGTSVSKFQLAQNSLFFSYASLVYWPGENDWLQEGDKLISDVSGGTFTAILVYTCVNPWPGVMAPGTYTAAFLEGFKWPDPGNTLAYWSTHQTEVFTGSFTRGSMPSTAKTNYTVITGVPKSDDLVIRNVIKLDTVENLVPGDKLDLRAMFSNKTNATFTVNDIDTERNEIITLDPIEVDISASDVLYMNHESLNQLVFEPFKSIVAKCNTIGLTDYSRFVPATLSTPALSFLPFRLPGTTGDKLLSPSDMQPTLTGIMVKGMGSMAWSGTPETAWNPAVWTKYAIWTNQQTTAPSILMPDDTNTIAPFYPRRNRTLFDWKRRNIDYDDGNVYNPADNAITLTSVVYDYSCLRRWRLYRTALGTSVACTQDTWNGTSWTSATNPTWSGNPPQSLIPFPPVASSLGSGYSLLCLDSAGVLSIKFGTVSASYILPTNLTDGVLKQTPWGQYIVTSRGYGKVIYSAGTLTVNYVDIQDGMTLNLIPSTFCAIDSNSIYIMSGATYKDESDKIVNELYLYNVLSSPDSSNATAAVISYEKIFNGVPRLAMAFKDPSSARIIGLLGGRILQIANTLADTIERYSVQGLTAQEVIENVCMINNAMAIPKANGVLQIISRTLNETVSNITVIQNDIKQSRISDNFFSQVNVSGNDSSIYGYSVSSTLGGTVCEISQHPFITTTSQARAVADTYIQFFGKPRKEEIQTWTWASGGIAPWESLQPFQKITINGGSTIWLVMSVNRSLKDYKATVRLIEF